MTIFPFVVSAAFKKTKAGLYEAFVPPGVSNGRDCLCTYLAANVDDNNILNSQIDTTLR